MSQASNEFHNKVSQQYSVAYSKQPVNWKEITTLKNFTSFWRKEIAPETLFQACHDSSYLYFRFTAVGSEPKVYVKENHKMEVINSERVELFLRSNERLEPYFCLEMDPLGRVLDYKAFHYRKFDYHWQWPDSLSIEAEIHNSVYTVEAKLSVTTLKNLGLLIDNEIQVGLFRGHCTKLMGSAASMDWISWIDPITPSPDFHVPSAFGKFVLIDF